MRLYIILACITAVATEKNNIECTTCIKVASVCHNVSYLFELQAPFRNEIVIPKLGILRSNNRLFFAFEPAISDPEYYKIGFVDLDNTTAHGIIIGNKNVSNFGTFDVDQINNIVYLGSSDGIYILDADNKGVFFSSASDTIKSIFYKGNVLFTRDGENKIIQKIGDNFRMYDEYRNVKNFVITNDNTIVFLNTTGLYASKFKMNNTNNPTVYLSKNNFIRGLVLDLEGGVYAWWIDTVYKIVIEKDIENSMMVKIAEIFGLGSMTFDNNNNILFNSRKGLYKLSPTNTTLC